MYIGKIGGIKLKLNIFFLILMILMGFFGMIIDSLLIFMVVIIHEIGHVIMAKRLKYNVESIELLPIGGVAKINETHYKSSSDEWFIAGAGPLNNLLFIIVLLLYGDFQYFETLINYNLTLFFFNLLPALPLDGGRLLKAHLAKDRPYQEAKKIASVFGILIGIIILGISMYYYHIRINNYFYLGILGVFLSIAALKEFKAAEYLPISLSLAKEDRINKINQGKVIICPEDMAVKDVMKELESNRELVVCIIDHRGEVVDMITEKIIVDSYNKGYGSRTLQEILM